MDQEIVSMSFCHHNMRTEQEQMIRCFELFLLSTLTNQWAQLSKVLIAWPIIVVQVSGWYKWCIYDREESFATVWEDLKPAERARTGWELPFEGSCATDMPGSMNYNTSTWLKDQVWSFLSTVIQVSLCRPQSIMMELTSSLAQGFSSFQSSNGPRFKWPYHDHFELIAMSSPQN